MCVGDGYKIYVYYGEPNPYARISYKLRAYLNHKIMCNLLIISSAKVDL